MVNDAAQALTQAIRPYLPVDAEDWFAEHVARAVVGVLTTNGWALVQPPSIAFKGPRDTDASMFLVAADKAESAKYPVGGSNVGRAVADILRQVAAAVSPTQKEPGQ